MFRPHLASATFLIALCCASLASSTAWTAEAEQPLIDILLDADAAKADKAITCKKLAVWGSAEAVPAVAALLPDPELTSWARIALENIPDAAADQALIDALDQVDGLTLVGVINSIGVRRSAGAEQGLIEHLANDDLQVAAAAAAALGKLDGESVVDSLTKALAEAADSVKSAAAEGLILTAERWMADEQSEQAAELYDRIRAANVAKPRIVEATRGAILARGADGIDLLVQQLQSDDQVMVAIGLTAARELEGAGASEALVAAREKVPTDKQPLLILALADRGDAAVLPAMTSAVQSGEREVKIAAIAVLQNIGDESCIDTLLDAATSDDATVADAGKMALAQLSAEKVDENIVARISGAEGAKKRVLLELVGMRRIDAVQPLLASVNDTDAQTRAIALTALGEVASLDDLSVLIDRVTNREQSQDAEVALQALRAACVRMPDRDACATKLTAAMQKVPTESKITMLEVLTAMGGAKSLEAIRDAANSGSQPLQDAATRLLGEWMTVDAGPVALEVANDKTNPYRVRALRGYIRLVRQFLMPDDQRVEMARLAMDAAERDDEKLLLLQVAQRYPSIEMLRLAVDAAKSDSLKSDSLKSEAENVAMVIAKQISGSEDVEALLKQLGQDPVKIEIIEAKYGTGDKQKDVTKVLQDNVSDFPLIVLPSSTYNTVFGGDPAPGLPKELTIKYRINEVDGNAVFRENTAIMLPIPQ